MADTDNLVKVGQLSTVATSVRGQIDTINAHLGEFESLKYTDYTSLFAFIANASNGATADEDTQTVTVPSGNTGSQSYLGCRCISEFPFAKGKSFHITVPYTKVNISNVGSSGYPRVQAFYQNNGTGVTWSNISIDEEKVSADVEISDFATATYILLGVKIVATSSFASDASVTIGEFSAVEVVTARQAVADVVGDGRWFGKKMSCFGDSYTAADKWQPKAKEILGLSSYENTAISGGILTTNYVGIENVASDTNILTIWYGTNDYANNKELGSIDDDATSPTTFYGALKYVFEYVSTNLPKCIIIPITHTQRWASTKDLEFITNNGYGTDGQPKNNLGYSLADYADAIVKVAARYGCRTLDLNHWGQINKNNYASYYSSDYLHPSAVTYLLIGEWIANFILSL